MTVNPYLAAIVDTVEVQPEAAVVHSCCGRSELSAIPPAAAIRAVRGHGQIGEILTNGIASAGNAAQIRSKVRIGEDLVRGLRGEYRTGHGRLEPVIG